MAEGLTREEVKARCLESLDLLRKAIDDGDVEPEGLKIEQGVKVVTTYSNKVYDGKEPDGHEVWTFKVFRSTFGERARDMGDDQGRVDENPRLCLVTLQWLLSQYGPAR
jgi:hypothetical protein